MFVLPTKKNDVTDLILTAAEKDVDTVGVFKELCHVLHVFIKFSLNSLLSITIHLNLPHSQASLFLCSLLLSLGCFSTLIKCYFEVHVDLKVGNFIHCKT